MALICRQPLQKCDTNIESNISPLKQVEIIKTPKSCEKKEEINENVNEQERNVSYFRNLITQNTSELLKNCSIWEEVKLEIDDQTLITEVQGDIRTTIGQAKLVIKERFKQFEGLVDNCEFNTSEKQVTVQDLQGFWDMIFFQVEDVLNKFKELENRKENNWIKLDQPVVKTKKIVKKLQPQPRPKKSRSNIKQIEARKRLAAAKAAMKIESANPTISFDAVFFKVNSPIRTIKERTRTPSTLDHKKHFSTPSSGNFLHGRFLKQLNSTSDVKKSLNFDKNEKLTTPTLESKNNTETKDLQDMEITEKISSENEKVILLNENNILEHTNYNNIISSLPSNKNNSFDDIENRVKTPTQNDDALKVNDSKLKRSSSIQVLKISQEKTDFCSNEKTQDFTSKNEEITDIKTDKSYEIPNDQINHEIRSEENITEKGDQFCENKDLELKEQLTEITNVPDDEIKTKCLNIGTQTISKMENDLKQHEKHFEKEDKEDHQKEIFEFKQRILELENQNKERQICEENFVKNDEEIPSDFYRKRYHQLLNQVKINEVELSSFRELKTKIKSTQSNLKEGFNLLNTRAKDAELCHSRLLKWAKDLELKSKLENEELVKMKQIHDKDLQEKNCLKNKVAEFDEMTEKIETLSTTNEKFKNELLKMEEKCELIREDRNKIRENYNEQLRVVEGLEASLENEKFTSEESKIFVQEQKDHIEENKKSLKNWDILYQEMLTKKVQLNEEIKKISLENSDQKSLIEEQRQEIASIQHELNITKANARLSILEQQQEVVNSEQKLKDLHFALSSFSQQLKSLDTDGVPEDQTNQNGYLETPSKSIVVSALRAGSNQQETPDVETSNQNIRPEANLFTLIGECTNLMNEVLGSSQNVASNFKEKITQLNADKNSLLQKVQNLKEKLQDQDNHKNEIEVQLRIRLNEVIQQRDKRTEEITARENVIKTLSLKLQNQEN